MKDIIKNLHWIYECGANEGVMTVQIAFTAKGKPDETEFDVENAEELGELFEEFCAENNLLIFNRKSKSGEFCFFSGTIFTICEKNVKVVLRCGESIPVLLKEFLWKNIKM